MSISNIGKLIQEVVTRAQEGLNAKPPADDTAVADALKRVYGSAGLEIKKALRDWQAIGERIKQQPDAREVIKILLEYTGVKVGGSSTAGPVGEILQKGALPVTAPEIILPEVGDPRELTATTAEMILPDTVNIVATQFGPGFQIGSDSTVSPGARGGKNVHIGDGVNIYDTSLFGDDITLRNRVSVMGDIQWGNRIRVGSDSFIECNGNFGNDLDIAGNVNIKTGIHSGAPVTIGNDFKVGPCSTIAGTTIEDGVKLGSDVITSEVTIGRLSQVGNDSSIRGSIGAQTVVGDGCTITANVGKESEIGNRCEIHGSVGDRVKMGDSVIVDEGVHIPSGTTVPTGTHVGRWSPYTKGPNQWTLGWLFGTKAS